ncbi:TonB system transport protein ExbD [Salinarimonas ramus]|uniref:Biopolymer transport protein ExbD n=1 Tax=Salinarimonas ramus TaxID=690164 RepID=A0A917Q8N8_9HYPH|nr:TonB system transport protein ExbD [Salinarimonas ramus]GGK35179.1 TonB system transport protein ExbD [Salinarimonas ramus]
MAFATRPDGDEDAADELAEINVTPFIDVILVLLIVFMIAAPLATVSVPVDLPASNAAPQPAPAQPVVLTLDAEGALSLGEETIDRAALASALDAATGGDRTTRVFLRADQTLPYRALMDLLNELRAAGYLAVALVGLETSPVDVPPGAP